MMVMYPDYKTGLVISDKTVPLTAIPFRNVSNQLIQEYFKLSDMDEACMLTVTSN